MQERYQRHERHWRVFLERADVEPTNNASERALRPVVHRKANGGFRSEWGAGGYARFISVVQTAQKQGQAILPTLLAILAPHPLPILEYLQFPNLPEEILHRLPHTFSLLMCRD